MNDFKRIVNHLKANRLIRNQKDLADTLEVSQAYITRMKNGTAPFTESMLFKIEAEYNITMKSGVITDAKTYKKLNNITQPVEGKIVPIVEGDFLASIVPQGLSDTIAIKPETFINIPMFSRGEYAIQVSGSSMKGYINHGDWCIIRRIYDIDRIVYGEPYVIVSKSNIQRTVKFVNQHKEDDNLLWLSPYNIEQHESYEIEKEDILEMYEVIGIMRKFA